MKKIISLLLVAALLGFLCMTNPTTEEFAVWYAEQTAYPETGTVLDDASAAVTAYLARGAERSDYMICSVFTFNGHKTLGIGLMFFSVDSLSEQVDAFRTGCIEWLNSNSN